MESHQMMHTLGWGEQAMRSWLEEVVIGEVGLLVSPPSTCVHMVSLHISDVVYSMLCV